MKSLRDAYPYAFTKDSPLVKMGDGTPGRPPNLIREAYIAYYGFAPWCRRDSQIPDALVEQLQQCRSEEARRLILGISEKGDTGYMPDPKRVEKMKRARDAGKRARRTYRVKVYDREYSPRMIERVWQLITRLGPQGVRPKTPEEKKA